MLIQRAVGTFPSYNTAEIALQALQKRGFSMNLVSLIGLNINHHQESTGANTSNQLSDLGNLNTEKSEDREAAKNGAIAGSAVGGITGLLVGLGAIAIPGVGPVMLAGAAATAIASALSGTAIGAAAGSLTGGLVSMGVSTERAQTYSDRVTEGDYLVMVEGTAEDIAIAEFVLLEHDIQAWHVYDLPEDARAQSTAQPLI
jgi:hypothetical protein